MSGGGGGGGHTQDTLVFELTPQKIAKPLEASFLGGFFKTKL